MSTPYVEQFSEAFNAAKQFGTAQATAPEFAALGDLHRANGRDRDATRLAIEQNGYPLPAEITAEDVALTAAVHACGVAIYLAEERGFDGRVSTYESYTAKNRFDRFTALHLPEDLRATWRTPLERQIDASPKMSYPDATDFGLIHGIGKPSRYMPAQTMRNAEFARLGKSNIPEEDQSKYAIRWETLIPTIEAATNTVHLAGAIGAEVGAQLLANGLDKQQVATFLKSGFSTRGIKEEHGDVAEADQVYNALMTNLAARSETRELSTLLAA